MGLIIVKVNVVIPFTGNTATPKALLIVEGNATTVLAEAALPLPASMEPMAEVVLFFNPSMVPVTMTESVQVVFDGSVAPFRLIAVAPLLATMVVNPQVLTSPLGVATTKPAGSKSVNETPVRGTVLLLTKVKVKLVFRPIGNAGAPKALLMVGGAATTNVAMLLAAPAAGVSVVVTPEVLLLLTPVVLLVTAKITVQTPLAGMLIPEKVNTVAPANKVPPDAVPTQVPPNTVLADVIPTNKSLKNAP